MPQLDLLTWETHLFSMLISVVFGYFLVNHILLPLLFVSFQVQAFCLYHLENILFSVNNYLLFIFNFDSFFKNFVFNLKDFFIFFFKVIDTFVTYLVMFCHFNNFILFCRSSCLSFFSFFTFLYVYFLFSNIRNCFYLMFINSLE